MSDIFITGTFTLSSIEEVCEHLVVFTAAQGRPVGALKASPAQADYKDDQLDAFIQPILTEGMVSVEAEYAGTLGEARQWVEGLITFLEARRVSADFDLWEEDEGGGVVGEMLSFESAAESPRTSSGSAMDVPAPAAAREAGVDLTIVLHTQRRSDLAEAGK